MTNSIGLTRLRGIDALRGVAALGVVLFHAIEQGRNVVPNNFLEYPVRGRRHLWLAAVFTKQHKEAIHRLHKKH